MRLERVTAAALVAALMGALLVPALAAVPDGTGTAPVPGTGMTMDRTGHGMMGRGMMHSGMTASGCNGMMQSMAGDDGRPNSQWRTHPPSDASD